ncbi:MAG TPA: GNAT family N-acetyltransferase [Candidatus Dormibacteraeota bacterium]|nr:GNAT family N-acetyltransferase [Candidatus Dormibacteraeota bacterium]
MGEWGRAISFMRAIDEACAEQIVESRFGRVLINRSLFSAPDLNYLLADRALESVTTDELASECERIQGPAGIPFRRANVDDEDEAERLLPAFAGIGFQAERFCVMVHHRAPDREVDMVDVRQVDWTTYEPGRREEIASWAPSRLIAEQALAKQQLTSRVIDTSYWCAFVDGSPASFCEVRRGDSAAQIEFVETLERFRRRGLARQLVLAALDSVRDSGFIFLVADLFNWPQYFYERLGFDRVGIESRFIRHLNG